MQTRTALIWFFVVPMMLAGCAGQTTDPRQGGLFSYNPDAYEQRLRERQYLLDQEEQATRSIEVEQTVLEAEKISRAQEKAALEKQVREFNASMNSLEQQIQSRQATTEAQKKERQRMLAEIAALRASTDAAESLEDAEKQRELERLEKKRDDLEREAASLMLL
ncbi:hypothetical protein [Desulfobulbus alkaliphilus]|uniref:hypothetical protein n=1 Tax=Desulfobulbus alkaliphilus TaxID=869814 RepID=UPI0019644606|nr:hypothetical protein [Desulfobulbus alkaliphilus]MBM9536206.1 hypothetical protein [Desulfobulbus alkaliphilus]